MKLFIACVLITILTAVLGITCNAQSVKLVNGKYVSTIKATIAKDTAKPAPVATYTDNKGVDHPVYKGSKGGMYYITTSKSGNEYKHYLRIN